MRVVLTVERYFPLIGGAERVVQRVAEGLAERGHEAVVVTSGARGSEVVGGVRVERFPVRGNRVRGIRGDAQAAVSLVRELRPDVVFNYAAQTWTTDAFLALLEDPDRPPMVLAPCGFSALDDRRYRDYFRAMPDWLRRYDALVLHSSVYRDWDFAVAAGAQERHVIPNGADPAPPVEPATYDPTLVTVGSHVRSKGHADFAHALRALRRRHRVTGLIVAPPRRGLDGLRGCQLQCRVRAARPGSGLRLVDGRPPGAVSGTVASARALLLPSRVECAPLVLLEAMAAGVPWISYDVGNARELAGGLVVSGVDGLVSAAGDVLGGAHPELGREGRARWAERHRWEQIVPRYEALFAKVAAAPRAPVPSPAEAS